MKSRITSTAVFIVLTGLIFLLTAAPAFAQGQNLLTNPGFEPPFATVGGNPPREVAQGWLPWNVSGGASASELVQPDYCAASAIEVPCGLGIPRIHGGTDAQQYHTFFATMNAGVYQRVTTGITAGAQLQFSVFAYVWSTSLDDVDKSEQDGGVVMRVGIDPTGGTDATSANIVWSSPTVQYDTYAQYSVTAAAQGSAVTVFVSSNVSFPVKYTNIYVDDASLTVVGGSQVPSATNTRAATATNTVLPTNTPGDLGLITPTATFTVTIPPTFTSIPPTSTAIIAPTFTAVPTSTQIVAPTFTPVETSTTPPPTLSPTAPPTATLPPTSTSAPPPTAPAATPTTGTPISDEFPNSIIHVVQPGDTVGRLATLYGSTIDAIIEANGLNQFAFIRVGQRLAIPVRLAAPATSTPTNTPAVVIVVTATPGPVVTPVPATSDVYVVQPGDTLFRIAARYNTTVATLAQLNGIVNANVIRVGQRLIVPVPGGSAPPTPAPPPPTSAGPTPLLVTPTPAPQLPTAVPTAAPQTIYTVLPGDTLYRIALRFGVPMSRIIQANGIVNPNLIYVGQRLVIQ